MNDEFDKVKRFFASGAGQVIVGLLCSITGFFINDAIQHKLNKNTFNIIREILTNTSTQEVTTQLPEKIINVLETVQSPSYVQSFTFAILSFFLGISITKLFSSSKKKDESETMNENVIVNFLEHLIEDCYSRCSNTNCQDGCLKLASECDGLLKKYLYEESRQLKESIILSKTGKYALDNNIERFHTIAIDHLIAARSRQYAVVQWIGSKPYSDNNKYQETYDRMDFHFLNVLIERLTTTNKKNRHHTTFKIKWLLIGDINCMQNNFDYIFYVIKTRPPETVEVIKGFFEFYLITESDYMTAIEPILARSSPFFKSLLNIKNEPSFGIFGENFMFADSPDPDHHGTIYTRTFIPENGQQDVITSVNNYFDNLIKDGNTKRQNFDDLMKQYSEIVNRDRAWEGNLKTIWNPETQ